MFELKHVAQIHSIFVFPRKRIFSFFCVHRLLYRLETLDLNNHVLRHGLLGKIKYITLIYDIYEKY